MRGGVGGVGRTAAEGDGVRGGRGSILIRAPEAQSRGILYRSGVIWDQKERVGGWSTFILEEVCEEGIRKWVCVRAERKEGVLWPPFEEAVVVLDGPPAKELKTSVKLEDRRLVKVRRIEEDGVEMERGSGTQTERAVKEGRAVLLSACRKDISKAAKEGRGRSCRINLVKPGDREGA